MRTHPRFQIVVIAIYALVGSTTAHSQIETELRFLNLAYTCVVENWVGPRLVSRTRLFYDRGRFREETLNLRTGKMIGLTVYNHDGQGLPFSYYKLTPPEAGVSLDGIMYRLAKDDPAAYRRYLGLPKDARVVEGGRKPTDGLRRFEPNPYWKFRKVGKETIEGKECTVYEPGVPQGSRCKVWRGYVLEAEQIGQQASRRVRISKLKFVSKLSPSLFELLPGTVVKVPRDLKVHLPGNVKRVEYPGNGLVQR